MPIPGLDSNRYILTGGPGFGKTSILLQLQGLGHEIVKEAATDIFKELQDKQKIKEPWTTPKINERIVQTQEKRQEAIASKTEYVFLDRSPIDTYTYCCMFYEDESEKETVKKKCDENISSGFFNTTVFLIESIDTCTQTEVRPENLDGALKIHERLKAMYEELGFNIVKIKNPPDEKLKAKYRVTSLDPKEQEILDQKRIDKKSKIRAKEILNYVLAMPVESQ